MPLPHSSRFNREASMDTSKLMEQLRARICGFNADEIMEDVEIACRLRERIAYHRGARDHTEGWVHRGERYPLPTRKERVLREEPVPGTSGPVYRWNNGRMEARVASGNGGWMLEQATLTEGNVPHLRHAIDLHDNPYRETSVPVDPDNPWPEDER